MSPSANGSLTALCYATDMTHDPADPRSDHQSYVLRLWLVREADRIVWRASLQAIPAGTRQGFAALADLLAYLAAQTQPPAVAVPVDDEA